MFIAIFILSLLYSIWVPEDNVSWRYCITNKLLLHYIINGFSLSKLLNFLQMFILLIMTWQICHSSTLFTFWFSRVIFWDKYPLSFLVNPPNLFFQFYSHVMTWLPFHWGNRIRRGLPHACLLRDHTPAEVPPSFVSSNSFLLTETFPLTPHN